MPRRKPSTDDEVVDSSTVPRRWLDAANDRIAELEQEVAHLKYLREKMDQEPNTFVFSYGKTGDYSGIPLGKDTKIRFNLEGMEADEYLLVCVDGNALHAHLHVFGLKDWLVPLQSATNTIKLRAIEA